MSIQRQTRQVGDTRIAVAATLVRPDGAVVDLTNLTVKFAMYNIQTGVAKVAETASNVTVTSATDGEVEYAPQAADVDTEGVFHAYFIAETGASAQDTFPVIKGEFEIVIEAVT